MNWTRRGVDLGSLKHGAVVLGNGLNRVAAGPSWEDVLTSLFQIACPGSNAAELDRQKPFPLLYEEIFLRGARASGTREEELLAAVAQFSERLEAGPIHAKLAALPAMHLLTTNYDRATVESFLGSRGLENAGSVPEKRYSVFRRVSRERTVWQIHGSQATPQSIMLGYEHYAGYLEQMRRYVTRSATYQRRRLPGLTRRRARGGLGRVLSWVDLFFVCDIAVLGLSLDFVEMHLWWLLTYRARQRATCPEWTTNHIAYFSPPESLEVTDHQEDKIARRRRLLAMLEAADVEVIESAASSTNWSTYYSRSIGEVGAWLAAKSRRWARQ